MLHPISILPSSIKSRLTNASNPCGACMTELGCSSSSDRGLEASAAAFVVSSYDHHQLISVPLLMKRTSSPGFADRGGSGVASVSSFSIAVSSMSVVSVPLEEVAMGEGSAISLGLLVAREE